MFWWPFWWPFLFSLSVVFIKAGAGLHSSGDLQAVLEVLIPHLSFCSLEVQC